MIEKHLKEKQRTKTTSVTRIIEGKEHKCTSFKILLFSEGGFALGTTPAFFVLVWHPSFVLPGPAPTFFSHIFLHHREILFSMVHVHSGIKKNYNIVKDVSFLIFLYVPSASYYN